MRAPNLLWMAIVGTFTLGCFTSSAPMSAGTEGSSTGDPADPDVSTASSSSGAGPSSSGGSEPDPSTSAPGDDGRTTGGGDVACEIWVDDDGADAVGCGDESSPCRTITHAFGEALPGCTVQVGPGIYGVASGEALPLELPDGVDLVGAGSDRASEHTLLDDTAGASAATFDVACDEEPELLRSTLVVRGGRVADLIVRGGLQQDYASVLVLEGESVLDAIRVERGQDGIYTAGAAIVDLLDVVATQAGHAAIKPAGDSVVSIERATLFGSKDAVEPICRATTTVRDSEAYCNGNGLEALDRATTTLIDNDVHHNINGVAARGGAILITARGNDIHDNAFGIVDIFGDAILGTSDDPGNNQISNNRFAGVMLNQVAAPTPAIGNIWEPGVDGADAAGEYSGAVAIAGPVCGRNNAEVEAPIPDPCDPQTPIVQDPTYQNYVLNDGSCASPPTCGAGLGACMPLGELTLSTP
ncbi:MAG: right-handed parallel beta-helix repeat-containing protein [Myxococcota bacterium]